VAWELAWPAPAPPSKHARQQRESCSTSNSSSGLNPGRQRRSRNLPDGDFMLSDANATIEIADGARQCHQARQPFDALRASGFSNSSVSSAGRSIATRRFFEIAVAA